MGALRVTAHVCAPPEEQQVECGASEVSRWLCLHTSSHACACSAQANSLHCDVYDSAHGSFAPGAATNVVTGKLCRSANPACRLTPIVVLSEDIVARPEATLRALCAAIGLEWDPAMLKWPPGPKPYDGPWAPWWYKSVHASSGVVRNHVRPNLGSAGCMRCNRATRDMSD